MNAVPDFQAETPAQALAQPLDLRGRPLRDLRVSVIETCNYRCPYCMPEGLTREETALDRSRRLSFEEIEIAVRSFVRLGVRKVRLTGGEPLLRRNLPELVARLAAIPGVEDLALTTNGSLLASKAMALREAGLHRLTISLDALDPTIFRALSGGRGEVADVLAGISAAEEAGFESIKLNTVVQRGVNEDQVLPLVDHFRGTGHVLRFIEYMDVGTCNGWRRERVVPSRELHDRITIRWPLHALSPAYRGEVAARHVFEDGRGEVGFVSSISAPFCGDCHRARLSADGQLFTCLFAATGSDLRPALGGGEAALAERISALWAGREDRYSEIRDGRARAGDDQARQARDAKKIEMFYIGG
ncbi:MAG: GTP 3',8-cyclase MoaA [Arenimonas sp.]